MEREKDERKKREKKTRERERERERERDPLSVLMQNHQILSNIHCSPKAKYSN